MWEAGLCLEQIEFMLPIQPAGSWVGMVLMRVRTRHADSGALTRGVQSKAFSAQGDGSGRVREGDLFLVFSNQPSF